MFNNPRKAIRRSTLATRQLGTMVGLAALLGMSIGCGERSPTGPTLTTTVPQSAAPVAPSAVYSITANTNVVAPGGKLSVTWSAPPGGYHDWIGLFLKSDPNTAHGWSSYTGGHGAGTLTLSAPAESGQYEFRYLLDDGLYDAARSSVVVVGPGAQ